VQNIAVKTKRGIVERQGIIILPVNPHNFHLPVYIHTRRGMEFHTHPPESPERVRKEIEEREKKNPFFLADLGDQVVGIPKSLKVRYPNLDRHLFSAFVYNDDSLLIRLALTKEDKKKFIRLLKITKELQNDYPNLPSGSDIIEAHNKARSGSSSLLITPDRNILFDPTRAINPFGEIPISIEKMQNAIRQTETDVARESKIYLPAESMEEVESRLAVYNQLRDIAISTTIEKNTGLKTNYLPKGSKIRFTGHKPSPRRRTSTEALEMATKPSWTGGPTEYVPVLARPEKEIKEIKRKKEKE
jgi:hypothetical protein